MHAMDTIDDSQRVAAKVAGLAYLFTTAIVVFAEFAIRERLMVSGDVAATIQHIGAAERLWRTSLALNIGYCVGAVTLVVAMYVVLRPVSRHLALLAASWRLIYVMASVMMVLSMLGVARLSGNPDYARLLQADPLQGLVKISTGAVVDEYYVGLVFTSLASAVIAYLFYTSRYVPPALAAFGIVSSVWCVFCTVAYLVEPGFSRTVNLWWFDTPMALFDIAVSLWLLVRGLPARTPVLQTG